MIHLQILDSAGIGDSLLLIGILVLVVALVSIVGKALSDMFISFGLSSKNALFSTIGVFALVFYVLICKTSFLETCNWLTRVVAN
ncbi:hypothetical protein [Desulfofalx alkaliphila]|uniref:hypothetical protein n=1 Tax=Desulfofalx alkaliphila TaxID=105483 RepID=UPI0004E14750|nr:hypothetical protein [Desulfofalx alkaliphila]